MSRVQRRDSMLQQDQSLEDRLAAVEQALRTGAQLRDADLYGLRAGMWLTGGGILAFPPPGATYNFSWSARFILISVGAGGPGMPNNAGSGYVNIDMPANGIVITGVGGATNKTVAGGLIPLDAWDALYYILPTDGTTVSNSANFRVAKYITPVQLPANWVRIAAINADEGRLYVTGHGVIDYKRPLAFTAPWQNLSSLYTCGYRKTSEGLVILEGLASPTSAVAAQVGNVIGTLPAGYRPANTSNWFTVPAANILINSFGPYAAAPVGGYGSIVLYVDSAGVISDYGAGIAAGGWVSLAGITFYASS